MCPGNLVCVTSIASVNVWVYRYVMKNIMVQAVTHIYTLQQHTCCFQAGPFNVLAMTVKALYTTAKQRACRYWVIDSLHSVSLYAAPAVVWLLPLRSQHPRHVLCDVVQSLWTLQLLVQSPTAWWPSHVKVLSIGDRCMFSNTCLLR
jgi:hypothetical protein